MLEIEVEEKLSVLVEQFNHYCATRELPTGGVLRLLLDVPEKSFTKSKRLIPQDNQRERDMLKRVGLDGSGNRMAADTKWPETGDPIELKSGTDGNYSMGRDYTLRTLLKHRRSYWLMGSYFGRDAKWECEQIYFVPPASMDEIFFRAQATDLLRHTAELQLMVESVAQVSCCPVEAVISFFKHVLRRGMTVNDRPIKGRLVASAGVPLLFRNDRPYDILGRLIEQYPLDLPQWPSNVAHDRLFAVSA